MATRNIRGTTHRAVTRDLVTGPCIRDPRCHRDEIEKRGWIATMWKDGVRTRDGEMELQSLVPALLVRMLLVVFGQRACLVLVVVSVPTQEYFHLHRLTLVPY